MGGDWWIGGLGDNEHEQGGLGEVLVCDALGQGRVHRSLTRAASNWQLASRWDRSSPITTTPRCGCPPDTG